MSIYVAIPTLYDNQIYFTVKDAITAADNPDQITVGVAYMETSHNFLDYNEFYNINISKILEFSQVKLKMFKAGEYESSVGFGRNQALSMYSGEDYILQIDSHTLFEKGWDTKLINMYKEALEETKNDKTILTAYLSPYRHLRSGLRSSVCENSLASYPFILYRSWEDTGIPSWIDSTLVGPQKREKSPSRDELYLPCVKFNAQFVFTTGSYFQNTGLDTKVLFWEEELIQTINLLDSGFSLVFPNKILPLMHLYINDVSDNPKEPSYRVGGANSALLDKEVYQETMRKNWVDFVTDPANKDKIDRFSKYTRFNINYGPYNEWYIPKEYNK